MHNPIGEPPTMPIEVNSPHSGRPIKVRDQDVGRAVRDQEGRIFYVVLRSNGQGYYGAPTRHGSPKDEQRYLYMQARQQQAQDLAQSSAPVVHDATGRKRAGGRKTIGLLIGLLIISALILVFARGRLPFSEWLPAWLRLDHAPGQTDAPSSDARPVEPKSTTALPTPDPGSAGASDFVNTASGLHHKILEPGAEDQPFDSTDLRGQPLTLQIGGSDEIPGWDLAVTAMAEGERRTVVIPPNATLKYQIELIRVMQ